MGDTTKVKVGGMGKVRIPNSTVICHADGVVAKIDRESPKTLKEETRRKQDEDR